MQAKSRLYARRLRGDIGPIGLDPRTRLPGAILAPAVSLTGADQYYDEESDVQNFTLGSRMKVDQRTFHYSRAGHAIVVANVHYMIVMDEPASDIFLNTAAPASVIGDTTLAITVGAFQANVVLADELVGGYVELYAAVPGGTIEWRRIIAKTVTVGAGAAAVFTITVDRPFHYDYPALCGCLIHPCIYRATMAPGDSPVPVGFTIGVGVSPIPVQNAYYYWLQTWGPCFIGPTAGWALAVAYFQDVYMDFNGAYASSLHMAIGGVNPSPQRIGYALGADNIGTGQIMLQLAP